MSHLIKKVSKVQNILYRNVSAGPLGTGRGSLGHSGNHWSIAKPTYFFSEALNSGCI
jgi:hypothetical protein